MKAEPSSAGATFAVIATSWAVSITEISLASVLAAYDGWFTIWEIAWETPPVIRLMTPKTTIVLEPDRPIVQCAAERTQRDEIKAPPDNIVDNFFTLTNREYI